MSETLIQIIGIVGVIITVGLFLYGIYSVLAEDRKLTEEALKGK